MNIKRFTGTRFKSNYCVGFFLTLTAVLLVPGVTFSSPDTAPPSYSFINHHTSKFESLLSSRGWIGSAYKDSSGGSGTGFRFPREASFDWLHSAGLWVGGIVGTDTLVSVAAMSEYPIPIREPVEYAEFFNTDSVPGGSHFSQLKLIGGVMSTTRYLDTLTTALRELPPDFFRRRPHHPLHISVRQKSYSLDLAPFKNILLLDFTISNKGSQTINDAWVGYYVEPEAYPRDGISRYNDRLAGSLSGIATAYTMDADGIVSNGTVPAAKDAMAVKFISAWPPPADTNFNWWLTHPSIDFGPRRAPSTGDPYFDFESGRIGVPNGDRNKYYLLKHHEWDYDQVLTATMDSAQSAWLLSLDFWADTIAQGENASLLLSAGPFRMTPGQSIRVIFALFGAEYIHANQDNRYDLYAGNYELFRNGLSFDALVSNAALANDMSKLLVDPADPPTGLTLSSLNGSTAVIEWDPWVFPEATGADIYVAEVPGSMLLTPTLVRPDAAPVMPGTPYQLGAAVPPQAIIKGLQPGKLYFVSIANKLGPETGELSAPIVIGDINRSFDLSPVQPTRTYAHFYDSDSTIQINWSDHREDIAWYRIYRTGDSVLAANRFPPLIADTALSAPVEPVKCWRIEGQEHCFYRIEAYDSVRAAEQSYFDRHPQDGLWYWVTAVNKYGFESALSKLLKSEKVAAPTKDIIVILGTTDSYHDYVDHDSLFAFYGRVLEGYSYDLYDWSDNVLFNPDCNQIHCVDWRGLEDYRLVIVEDYPSPKIISDENGNNELLTRLIDGGHTVAYFGTPSNGRTVDLTAKFTNLEYETRSFVHHYLGLQSCELRPWTSVYQQFNDIDSLAGFSYARPFVKTAPPLQRSTAKRMTGLVTDLFNTDACVPLVPAFIPERQTEVVYLYGSAYPASSQLEGMACGVRRKHQFADAYSFSFHLWSIEDGDARSLIDYLFRESPAQLVSNSPPVRPVSSCLATNYPNPFNDATVIEFTLPAATEVSIDVFNVLGQKVRTLASGTPYSAGRHRLTWDGLSSADRPVASGVYFYRITTGSETLSRKMVLLK